MMTAESVRCYALKIDDDGHLVGQFSEDGERPDIRVHQIITRRMAQTGEDYAVAFEGARRDPEHENAFRAYGEMIWI
jgi:hypothetical protein